MEWQDIFTTSLGFITLFNALMGLLLKQYYTILGDLLIQNTIQNTYDNINKL